MGERQLSFWLFFGKLLRACFIFPGPANLKIVRVRSVPNDVSVSFASCPPNWRHSEYYSCQTVIPDTSSLLVSYLPVLVFTGIESSVRVAYEPPFFGSCSISFESDPPYWSLSDALMNNTFMITRYAICVLEGYMIAIIKTSLQLQDIFYIFDSHSRDSSGWPTGGNEGTAVLMTFANLSFLGNHICTPLEF